MRTKLVQRFFKMCKKKIHLKYICTRALSASQIGAAFFYALKCVRKSSIENISVAELWLHPKLLQQFFYALKCVRKRSIENMLYKGVTQR